MHKCMARQALGSNTPRPWDRDGLPGLPGSREGACVTASVGGVVLGSSSAWAAIAAIAIVARLAARRPAARVSARPVSDINGVRKAASITATASGPTGLGYAQA